MRDLAFIYKTIAKTLSMYDRFTPNRYILILNTGYAETGYIFPSEDGFWQLEYATVKDLLVNVLPSIKNKASYFDLPSADSYTEETHNELMLDLSSEALSIQIRLVDLKYRTEPEPLPHYSEIWRQAKYWKKTYNTLEGAGTVEHFVREVLNCENNFIERS